MRIALAGNPNSGKTTLFNELTGSAQHVGNWPGVTVEKKEGPLKHHKDVLVVDLPGIYSLSPYTLEEVIARDYIVKEKPDVIINIIDATNIERNLYLTTQILETNIPTIIALNMMDVVKKSGDEIDIEKISKRLNAPVVGISAAYGEGLPELLSKALKAEKKAVTDEKIFSEDVEAAIEKIINKLPDNLGEQRRYYAIKLFERDEKILEELNFSTDKELDELITSIEDKYDEDSDSLITNERYQYVGNILKGNVVRKAHISISTSDKIDKVVTNKWLALPIFFGIMWLIYYLSITTIGDMFIGYVEEAAAFVSAKATVLMEAGNVSEMLQSLVNDGVIGGIGAIFTFVPQMMILFFFLSLLEDSGYMARVAFIMDRIFRKFGLSGKSFIPMLIGTGCSVPAIMASRTVENVKDRDMTILLTPFVPCGAKMPVFGMFIVMLFPTMAWVGPSIYIIALAMIIVSGIILKRTKRFKGDPAPFVMELPTYKLPRLKGVIIHMWDKAKAFIIRAGTVIFISVIVIWFLQSFSPSLKYIGVENMDDSILAAFGNAVKFIFKPLGFGNSWATPAAAVTGMIAKEVVVATFASIGSVVPIEFSQVSAFSFMMFTVFAAPCIAAIGAMRAEFGNTKDTVFALVFQTGVAYIMAFLANTIGNLVFAGTDATKLQPLDYTIMEDASEAVDISGGGQIVLVIFGLIIAAVIINIIIDKVKHSGMKTAKKGV
ncbi:MAG: ferrous iron transport protein B [Tissierellia bacterium]|nr:ferrous iron transport protein B [Tissierellia bacterium]